MTEHNASLAAIEQQRLALETQVKKLKNDLKYWQTWDIEYEGLKEEIQALPDQQPSTQQLLDLSTAYDGTLVDSKEIRDMTGLTSDAPRKQNQIIDLIDRRIEYVTRNIESISRQFYAAENKLEEFAFAESVASGADPRFDDEDEPKALPFLEIHEQLDDDDNVISSEVRNQEDETRAMMHALNKAKDANPISDHDQHNEAGSSSPVQRPPIRKKSVSFSADTKEAPEPPRSESQEGRKSVSFAPKVAVAPAADPPDTRSVSFAAQIEEIPDSKAKDSEALSDKQKDLRASFKPGEKVYEIDEDADTAEPHIVLPQDESPEDARIRREMLQYHLEEVGNVVAQMELDEADDHSDFTTSEYLEEGDTPYTSETDDEDEHGRSRHSQISESYHEEMKALQARLIGNLGQQPTDEQLSDLADIDPKDVHRLVIRGNRNSTSSAASSGSEADKKGKKRVSFAEAVDVADEQPTKVAKTDPEADTGVMAETLVERTTSSAQTTEPGAEDDQIVARRELAAEYYRRRNDMIKQQGGFKATSDDADEDDEYGQLMEERDGKLKKVSRFKAARLKH